jgi:glutathione S-transferase
MYPVLYSFRRCPYAIRARLALYYSGIETELREVDLADKPGEMLKSSPRGTVPVLVLPDGTVLEESLDIMYWALMQNDPDNWLPQDNTNRQQIVELIEYNDIQFKSMLDRYKYSVRYPEHTAEWYRDQASQFLQRLESLLLDNRYLLGDQIAIVDMALLPFIRQFANVDKDWFNNSQYNCLRNWLENLVETNLFEKVMLKQPKWKSIPE